MHLMAGFLELTLIRLVIDMPALGGKFTLMFFWSIVQLLIILEPVISDRHIPLADDYAQEEPLFLRIATIQQEPFVQLRWEPGLIANDRYEGIYVDILRELAQDVGFDYQFYLVPDGKTGQMGDDGRWNGLIGELERGVADLALAPIFPTAERHQIVNFTSPLSHVKISALSKHPQGSNDRPSTRSGRVPYGIVINSETYVYLRSSSQLENIRLNYGLIYVNSVMEGLHRTREGHFKLLIMSQLAEYYHDQEPCDLAIEDFQNYNQIPTSLAIKRSSDILDEINAGLDKLTLGLMLMERLEQRWLRGSCRRYGTLPTLLDTTTNLEEEAVPHQLIITSAMVKPYLMRSNKRGVEFEGYMADLIRQMAQAVPFDYEWRIQRRLGKQRNDGSWTGMIGDLLDERADIAAAPFIAEDSQNRILSYSRPFLESTLSMIIQTPSGNRELPIMMLEDLLHQTVYDFGVVHKSKVFRVLKKSNLPLYKQLYKEIKSKGRENRILSIEDGLNRVRGGNFALILESTDATFLSSRRPCDMVSLGQYFGVTNYAFAMKKGSPLVSTMNTALLRLQEDGVLQALFHKWWNADECTDITDSIYEAEEQLEPDTPDPTTTTLTTRAPIQPNFDDFDLDAILGLSTDSPPLPEDETFIYPPVDDLDRDRIFLTSPVSAFTPVRIFTERKSSKSGAMIPTQPMIPHHANTSISAPYEINPHSSQNDTERNPNPETPPNISSTQFENGSDPVLNNTALDESLISAKFTNTTEATTPLLATTTTETTTKRRHGRTRRPGRRKNKKRSTTPSLPSTTPGTTVSESHDFEKDINWFFLTDRPRVDDYEDYDIYNKSNSSQSELYTPFVIHKNTTFQVTIKVPSKNPSKVSPTVLPNTTTSIKTTTDTSSGSSGSTASSYDKAVIFVVVVHLLIFGWPSSSQDCHDNCRR